MDIRPYAQERGTGFPLILLHGNGESGAYFAGQMGPFSERYRVIAVDTRGHGRSPRGEGPFTLDRFAGDLKAFLDERGIKKAHILGFSDGGNIALLFALRYPAMVERLVLNGANLCPAGVEPRVQIPVTLGYYALALPGLMDRGAAKKRELLRLMVKEPHIDPKSLSQLTMPVLVVAGTHDMIRKAHTEAIAAGLPNPELCFLPGDHFVAAKHPELFNARVLAFLG